MYVIEKTKKFEKSIKKLERSGFSKEEFRILINVIDAISVGAKLDHKYKDHMLIGNMAGLCECHVRPNTLLLYRIDEKEMVVSLLDIGTHAQIFD